LRDCYRKVEAADAYALKLRRDLHESQFALAQCQDALAASCAKLDGERQGFGAAQQALTFERDRHKETTELLERVFEEARLSGELADTLSRRIAILEGQLVGYPLTKMNLALLDRTALQQSNESDCGGFLPRGSD
jgi:hypothetical protein